MTYAKYLKEKNESAMGTSSIYIKYEFVMSVFGNIIWVKEKNEISKYDMVIQTKEKG